MGFIRASFADGFASFAQTLYSNAQPVGGNLGLIGALTLSTIWVELCLASMTGSPHEAINASQAFFESEKNRPP